MSNEVYLVQVRASEGELAELPINVGLGVLMLVDDEGIRHLQRLEGAGKTTVDKKQQLSCDEVSSLMSFYVDPAYTYKDVERFLRTGLEPNETESERV